VVLLVVVRLRLLLAGLVAVLAANGVVLVRALDDPADAGEAVALTATADDERDPLDLVPRPTTPTTTPPVDTASPLPVPEDPPADPYEPEPEIRHGTIEIPAIGLSQPLFEGVSLTAINRGPSHWPGTAMPGQLGNVVVAGHRTTYTRPFWDLQALQPGDELVFTMLDGSRHVYALDGIEIVDPSAVHIVDQTYAYTATLFACHPRGSARQRIVARFTMRPPSATAAATAPPG